MKNIMSVCLLSLLLVAGCSKSPQKDAQQVESESPVQEPVVSSGELITLHARLDFIDAYTSSSKSANGELNASRRLNASVYLETDATREGSGADASYSVTSDSRVQGAIVAKGSLLLTDHNMSSTETYDMHNEWTELTDKAEGKFSIESPGPSLIGEGLSVAVQIEAPVTGTKKAMASSADGDAEIVYARSTFCSPQATDKNKDICTLNFTIDAIPTKAQDPAYEKFFESAKTLYTYQGKKNPDGGLIMYSSLAPVFGAKTSYHDGQFVTELDQQYTVSSDGTDISQHIHLVVWSTKRGDKWQPKGLAPLQKPEVMH